jgi:hypothetical protein
MRIVDVDPETFISIHPPSYPQYKYLLNISLQDIVKDGGKLFALKNNGSYAGRIMAFTNDMHRTKRVKAGLFGWFYCGDSAGATLLLDAVEEYLMSLGHKLIRGPRDEPIHFGGQGVMTHGLDEPLLFGVSGPQDGIQTHLENNGYSKDTEYYCMRWTAPFQYRSKRQDLEITITDLSAEEILDRADEIAKIYNEGMIHRPDVTLVDKKIVENFVTFYKMIKALDYAVFAIHDDKIVGYTFGWPNLYEKWAGTHMQLINWYSIIILNEYRGRYIYSSMENWYIDLAKKANASIYEATYIPSDNKHTIDICLKTAYIARKHQMYEKKFRRNR